MVQVNPNMVDVLEEAGLKFVGRDESGKRMEVCCPVCLNSHELKDLSELKIFNYKSLLLSFTFSFWFW